MPTANNCATEFSSKFYKRQIAGFDLKDTNMLGFGYFEWLL